MMDNSPEKIYQERVDLFCRRAEELKKKVHNLSLGRLYTFFCLALLGGLFLSYEHWALALGALVALGMFVFFLRRHLWVYKKLVYAMEMEEINREALYRLGRQWNHLPLREVDQAPPPYGDDLDLFGKASLFQLLCTGATDFGKKTLALWLSTKGDSDTIQSRQQAVEELQPLEFRQEIYLLARRTEGSHPEVFLSWLEGDGYLNRRPILKYLAPFLTGLMAFFLLADLTGHLWGRLWMVLLMVHIALSVIYGGDLDQIFQGLSSKAQSFSASSALIERLEQAPFQAPLLCQLQREFQGSPGALPLLKQLKKMIQLIELRQSALFYIPFQFLFLWDFHVLGRVEKWQNRAGKGPRKWFSAVGQLEALSSLAGLAYDEPHWCFPTIKTQGELEFSADQLGHPLIARKERVDNSGSLSADHPFCMITGSNMSGKTTYLRALGLNAVLALAGGPVCARSMTLSPFTLRTSICIRDSLELGISYFMAEVYKIKEVVESAGKANKEAPLFFLLDEILHGTNSKERKIAALGIIRYLVEQKALGIVTTHDLEIAQSEEIQDFTTHFHFRETFSEDQKMSFDYKLRPAMATSSNALKLIRMVGIDV